MQYKFSRKTAVILLITAVVGFVLYNVAPPEIEAGQYNVYLDISSDSISVSEGYNVTFQKEGSESSSSYLLTGVSTNVTVTIPNSVLIETNNPLTVIVNATGDIITAEEILVTLSDDDGFNLILRPTRQSGQIFTIEYQPLVKSQAGVLILVVVAILWFSEGISLVATSLMIPILIVLYDIQNPEAALAPFFDPAVALIFGGFLIGRALSKYELDKRLALLILSNSAGSGSSLILTVMGVTAFLSMWISNTASA
ncbi:MAG: SLC13 family permease, partial [Candidatus Thorarchaeota archaeon]